jgi:Glycosyl hydrolases family 16
VNWTTSAMTFLIDGAPVRTVKAADAKGKFPQTPMRLKLGIWAGGDSSRNKDQIAWAGGAIDWNKAPYEAVIDSVKIVNYNPADQYRYKDSSGTWQSIDIVGGTGGSANLNAEPDATSNNQGMMANSVSTPDSAAPAGTTPAPSSAAPSKVGTPQQSTTLSSATSSRANSTTSAPAKPQKTNGSSSSPLAITPLIAFCLVAVHFVL